MSRWAVYYIGSPDDARKYSYKIEFPYPEEDRFNSQGSLVYKSPCYSAPERDNVKFNDHNCFYAHRNLLNGYVENIGHLNYRITIYCNTREEPDTISEMLDQLSTDD